MGQVKQLLLTLIRLSILTYQKVGRLVNKPCCRFHPSCSDYALTAFQELGLGKGFLAVSRRLLRCHPWSKHHGYDPVLPKKENP